MGLFFCILILILNIALWIIFARFVKKSFSAKGLLSEIKQEAEKIIIEINRETDSAITLMEAKINQVKAVMENAEKKIMLYENTLIQKENEKQLYQQLTDFQQKNNPVQRAVNGYKSNSSVNSSEYLPLFTENAGTSDIKKSRSTKSESVSKKATQENSPVKKDKNLELDFSENAEDTQKEEIIKVTLAETIEPKVTIQDRIIKLAKEGFTPELIASKLNVSINVVTMTIDLYL